MPITMHGPYTTYWPKVILITQPTPPSVMTMQRPYTAAVWTKTGYGIIRIGESGGSWPQVVQALIHEVIEFSMHLCGVAYRVTNVGRLHTDCTSTYRFLMSHEQFSQVAQESGDALCYMLPDLAKVWNQLHRGRKRRA